MRYQTLISKRTSSLDAQQERGAIKVNVKTSHTYPIVLYNQYDATRLLDHIQRLMHQTNAKDIVIISDVNVGRLITDAVQADIQACGIQVAAHYLPAGESSKSIPALHAIWDFFKSAHVARRSLVLGIGGGVVCDITGLAAATYLRGLPYMLIPTSLMAQADAAIGGKVGADFFATKNWIGHFYHPNAVVMFTDHLRYLDDWEFSNGIAELLKVAAIKGGGFWDDFANTSNIILRHNTELLASLLTQGIVAKLDFLAPDPFEVDSLDRALNFGHCLGHAVEAASNFSLRHGYAVAIGMVMALRIGRAKGITDDAFLYDMEARLRAHDLPIALPESLVQDSWRRVEDLRKVRNGALRIAVPALPGRTAFLNDVTKAEFMNAANN